MTSPDFYYKLRDRCLDEAKTIADRANAEKRPLKPHEKKRAEELLETAKGWRDDAAMSAEIEKIQAAASKAAGSRGLGDQLLDGGFDFKGRPTATISAYQALGGKAAVVPGNTDLNPTDPGAIIGMGQDRRFLWPNLPRQNAGDATAVSDFRQTARSVTGTVERGITAVTDKAELNVTIEHGVEEMRQHATVLPNIPNAVLEADSTFRDFFNAEGRFQGRQVDRRARRRADHRRIAPVRGDRRDADRAGPQRCRFDAGRGCQPDAAGRRCWCCHRRTPPAST